MPGGITQDNTPHLEGLALRIEVLTAQASDAARRILEINGIVRTDDAVRALATTMLISAGETLGGGNPERAAFRAYADGLMTVLENATSAFARGGAGEFIDRG